MWIKELNLQRYGPLSPCHYQFRPGFNLLLGENDRGKTLLIEALLKYFFPRGRDRAFFANLERVEESPVGHALLEAGMGGETRELVLDGNRDLGRWSGVGPRDYRELFVVKDSDLALGGDEGQYFAQVTDRLTGLRTEQIRSIMEKIREIAWLTPEGRFRNLQQFKLKEKVDAVPELVQEAEQLLATMREQGYEGLRTELVRREGEAQDLKRQLRELEDARCRETYEKGARALEELRQAWSRKRELELYHEGDLERWRQADMSLGNLRDERRRVDAKLQERKELVQSARAERERLERELENREEPRRLLEEKVAPELEAAREESERIRAAEEKGRRLRALAWTATGLAGLSLAGAWAEAALLPFTALFLLASLLLWRPTLIRAREASRLAGRLRRLHLQVVPYGLEGEDLESLTRRVQGFLADCAEKKRELEHWKNREEQESRLARQLEEEELPRLDHEIEKNEALAEELRRQTGVQDLEDYRKRLKEKEAVEYRVKQNRELLVQFLGLSPEREPKMKEEAELTPEEEIQVFARRLAQWEPYRQRGLGVERYDEGSHRERQWLLQEREGEISGLHEQLQQWEEALDALHRRAARYFSEVWEEPFPPLRSVAEVEALRDWMIRWRREWEEQRRAAGTAQSIFESMLQEEQEQVESLFGPESEVSRYFARFTDGLFTEVRFDSQNGQIECSRQDGTKLLAASLSGGSYDQLYFAVRLALGQELLQGGPGFFIVDDPFLRADRGRLQRQMETLLRICDQGWQVLYFSAKDETREVLERELDGEKTNLVLLGAPERFAH